jgi:hypothetical protein
MTQTFEELRCPEIVEPHIPSKRPLVATAIAAVLAVGIGAYYEPVRDKNPAQPGPTTPWIIPR